jgi:ABC-type multidrug transport system ATPase subunit
MFLSYGERKKVSIARALLKDSKILLLDEITNSLDISAKKLVTESIKSLMKEGKVKLILFVTHSLDEVMSLSNRLLFIKRNKIFHDLKINNKTTLEDIEALF